MLGKAIMLFVAVAVSPVAAITVTGFLLKEELPADRLAFLAALPASHPGPFALGLFVIVALAWATAALVTYGYIAPLKSIAEGTRVIALTNRRHRLSDEGSREMREVAGSINALADRFLAVEADVMARINEARQALEEERNTLSALVAKLTQGVLVCNPEGRILLYNPRAQKLLEAEARATGAADWVGLGRSIESFIDETQIAHALAHIRHRLAAGDAAVLVPFVAQRPGGQTLSAHVVPVLDNDRRFRGYILTIEDITQRADVDARRTALLQTLTEGQRSAIASVRAAVETILAFPDMDEDGRQQFLAAIRDEAVKMSSRLDALEIEYAEELKAHVPFQEMLGSELVAAIGRSVRETGGLELEVDAPLDPIWLRVDALAIERSVLFLVSQLSQACSAKDLSLTLEQRGGLVGLALAWSGAPLHGEALKRWGLRNVMTDRRGTSLTLFEVIERHGGAIWAHPPAINGRPFVRVVLPVSEGRHAAERDEAEGGYGHDFDFRLFEETAPLEDRMNAPLSKLSYTVLDTETTGLDPRGGDEIIAIGAVRIVNGRLLRREIFDSLVKPKKPIPEASRAIHNISNEMVRGMPPITEVLPALHRFVEDTVIVGHNVDFDMCFFALAADETGVRFDHPMLDTLLLEHAIHANQEDKSLEAIARRLGVGVTARHSALGDAVTTAEIFLGMIPLLEERGIRTLAHAMAACAATPAARHHQY